MKFSLKSVCLWMVLHGAILIASNTLTAEEWDFVMWPQAEDLDVTKLIEVEAPVSWTGFYFRHFTKVECKKTENGECSRQYLKKYYSNESSDGGGFWYGAMNFVGSRILDHIFPGEYPQISAIRIGREYGYTGQKPHVFGYWVFFPYLENFVPEEAATDELRRNAITNAQDKIVSTYLGWHAGKWDGADCGYLVTRRENDEVVIPYRVDYDEMFGRIESECLEDITQFDQEIVLAIIDHILSVDEILLESLISQTLDELENKELIVPIYYNEKYPGSYKKDIHHHITSALKIGKKCLENYRCVLMARENEFVIRDNSCAMLDLKRFLEKGNLQDLSSEKIDQLLEDGLKYAREDHVLQYKRCHEGISCFDRNVEGFGILKELVLRKMIPENKLPAVIEVMLDGIISYDSSEQAAARELLIALIDSGQMPEESFNEVLRMALDSDDRKLDEQLLILTALAQHSYIPKNQLHVVVAVVEKVLHTWYDKCSSSEADKTRDLAEGLLGVLIGKEYISAKDGNFLLFASAHSIINKISDQYFCYKASEYPFDVLTKLVREGHAQEHVVFIIQCMQEGMSGVRPSLIEKSKLLLQALVDVGQVTTEEANQIEFDAMIAMTMYNGDLRGNVFGYPESETREKGYSELRELVASRPLDQGELEKVIGSLKEGFLVLYVASREISEILATLVETEQITDSQVSNDLLDAILKLNHERYSAEKMRFLKLFVKHHLVEESKLSDVESFMSDGLMSKNDDVKKEAKELQDVLNYERSYTLKIFKFLASMMPKWFEDEL